MSKPDDAKKGRKDDQLRHEEDRAASDWRKSVVDRMRGFDFLTTNNSIMRSTLARDMKFTLLALVNCWSKKSPIPFPSTETLSGLTGISRSGTLRAIRSLEATEVLAVQRRSNRANLYDLSGVLDWCTKNPGKRFAKGDAVTHDEHRDDEPDEPPGGCQGDTPGGVRVEPPPCQGDTPGGVRVTPEEIHLKESNEGIQKKTTILPPAGGEGSSSSSQNQIQKQSQPEKQSPSKTMPRDNATVMLERLYCDLYQADRGVAYLGGKPDKKSRAAFKAMHKKVGLEQAQEAIQATFASDYARTKRVLPWEILADLGKLIGAEEVADPSAVKYKLRNPNDDELREQLAVAGEDRKIVEDTRDGKRSTNPAWLFEHGFNPENTPWLNEDAEALNHWAAVQAAKGNITPRWRAMSTRFPKRSLVRMLVWSTIRPSDKRYQNFDLWRTAEARKEALEWEREELDRIAKVRAA